MAIRLTPLRIKALQVISTAPGITLGALAERLDYRRSCVTGEPLPLAGTPQGATRWGGGYVSPLVASGLVLKDPVVRSGGARLYITTAGKQALAEAAAGNTEGENL